MLILSSTALSFSVVVCSLEAEAEEGVTGEGADLDLDVPSTGSLTLSDLDSHDSVKWLHSGGYVFVTNAGARIGYREYLYDDKI